MGRSFKRLGTGYGTTVAGSFTDGKCQKKNREKGEQRKGRGGTWYEGKISLKSLLTRSREAAGCLKKTFRKKRGNRNPLGKNVRNNFLSDSNLPGKIGNREESDREKGGTQRGKESSHVWG